MRTLSVHSMPLLPGSKALIQALAGALLGVLLLPSTAATGQPEAPSIPPPVEPRREPITVTLGGVELSLSFSVRTGQRTRPTLSARWPDGRQVHATLPWSLDPGLVHSLHVEERRPKRGRPVLLVWAKDAQRRETAAAVLRFEGRHELRVLWGAETRWRGDPGERRRTRLVVEASGDTSPALLFVEHLDQNARPCTRHRWVVRRSRLDPNTGALRDTLPEGDWYPSTWREPEVTMLEATSPFARRGHRIPIRLVGDEPLRTSTRLSTNTGERRTGVEVPPPFTRRFAKGRLPDAPLWPVETFLLRLGPTGRRAPTRGWLVLAGEEGPGLRVPLQPGHFGRWLRIQPPTPLPWRCLSVGFAEVKGGPLRITELRVVTSLDQDDRVERLLERITEGDHTRALDAANRLGRLSPDELIPALRSRWNDLSARARRLTLPALVRILVRGEDSAAAWAADRIPPLLRVLPSTRTRRRAMEAMARGGTRGTRLLRQLAEGLDETALGALATLAARGGDEGFRLALERLLVDEGWKQPAVRRALLEATPTTLRRTALQQWTATAPPEAAAALLQALSRSPAWRNDASSLLDRLVRRADTFESRWRLARAARRLSPSPAARRQLQSWLRGGAPWMLRLAVLEALASPRGLPAALAVEALHDAYPRVRAAALRLATEEVLPLRLLVRSAHEDPWPMVRSAALRRASVTPAGLPLLRMALTDPSRTVRREALERLTEHGDRDAWPRVRAMLRNPGEWPDVLVAALGYVRAGCFQDAVPLLSVLVERSESPRSWTADRPVAMEAIDTLGALGGSSAEAYLRNLATRAGPLGEAARRALSRPGRCRRAARTGVADASQRPPPPATLQRLRRTRNTRSSPSSTSDTSNRSR